MLYDIGKIDSTALLYKPDFILTSPGSAAYVITIYSIFSTQGKSTNDLVQPLTYPNITFNMLYMFEHIPSILAHDQALHGLHM